MSTPHSPAPGPSTAEVLHARYAGRLPATLEELAAPRARHGRPAPARGLAGLRSYDLDRPRLRMGPYRAVLAEGQHEDLVKLLDRDLLIAHRPVLRTLVSRHIRQVWEEPFPDLAPAGSATA
ncbi:hypothetical protein AB0F18_14710 [Streptomyces sp. NPDC029216]|uniref:hypothetical protein n=1 Tax=Streptomyces sp. NPDC029216 TaxID=3154701 RepID=UPI0033F86100